MSIVRPSIVTPSYGEPARGWIDGLGGINGVAVGVYRGTIRYILADGRRIVDIIPVDYVCNFIICVGCVDSFRR